MRSRVWVERYGSKVQAGFKTSGSRRGVEGVGFRDLGLGIMVWKSQIIEGRESKGFHCKKPIHTWPAHAWGRLSKDCFL